jgi:holin-like protein
MLESLAVLLLFQCVGESLAYSLRLSVPGPVIGMLLLFCALAMLPALADRIEATALELLRHLSLLFVPAGVGVMVVASQIDGYWMALCVAVALSTVLAMGVTGVVTQALMKWQAGGRGSAS